MNFLYSGDNFGTIKEYNIYKILSSSLDFKDLVVDIPNKCLKRVTFISKKKILREDNSDEKELDGYIFVGYSNGTIESYSVPFLNTSRTPKIQFKLPGEIIFIEDISNNYLNEIQYGESIILVVTSTARLYLLKFPSIHNSQEPHFIDFCSDEDCDLKLHSKYLINTLKLPGTNIKCVSYNKVKNSIAFGGFESDIKLMSLDTFIIYWSSKNVHANILKHRIPVDVSKIVFLREDPEIILSGTGLGEIRIYSPNFQKRPLINYELWEDKSPVTSIAVIKYWGKYKSDINSYGSIFVVGNNRGSVLLIKLSYSFFEKSKAPIIKSKQSALAKKKNSLFVQKIFLNNVFKEVPSCLLNNSNSNKLYKMEVSILASFKGIMGGVTSISSIRIRNSREFNDCFFVVVGSLGRYLYIFDIKKKKLVKKIFNSQKVSCLFFN